GARPEVVRETAEAEEEDAWTHVPAEPNERLRLSRKQPHLMGPQPVSVERQQHDSHGGALRDERNQAPADTRPKRQHNPEEQASPGNTRYDPGARRNKEALRESRLEAPEELKRLVHVIGFEASPVQRRHQDGCSEGHPEGALRNASSSHDRSGRVG